MPKTLHLLLFFAFVCKISVSNAQWRVIVSDSLIDQNKQTDLSTLLYWGTNTQVSTAFQLIQKADRKGLLQQAITLSDSGKKYAASFTNINSLKTHAAFDYRFPEFDRSKDTVVVEFDAIWDILAPSGESRRLVVSMMYDYPLGGTPFNAALNTSNIHPFGRPAYNFRLLSVRANSTNDGLYMLYGGGNDPLGESEKTNDWWLPGFSTVPGGISPGQDPSYPYGANVVNGGNFASDTTWMHYKWVISPEKITLWYKKTGSDDATYRFIDDMGIADYDGINAAPTIARLNQLNFSNITKLPRLYHYFKRIGGVRFYFRGGETYVANILIQTTATKVLGLEENISKTNQIALSLIPNPSSGTIQLFPCTEEYSKLTICNLQGMTVFEGMTKGCEKISLEHLHPGIYIWKLEHKQTQYHGKIQIQK